MMGASIRDPQSKDTYPLADMIVESPDRDRAEVPNDTLLIERIKNINRISITIPQKSIRTGQ